MKIARRTPFDGPPRFTAPSVFCAAPGKPFLYRIPVLGKRPPPIYMFSACRMGFRTAETEYLRENLLSAFIL